LRSSMPQLPTEVWRRPDPDELSEASAEECLSGDEGAVAVGEVEGGDKCGAAMADFAASELVWELSRRQEQGSLRCANLKVYIDVDMYVYYVCTYKYSSSTWI